MGPGARTPPPQRLRVIILLYINFRPPNLPTVPLAFSLISCPPLHEMSGFATGSDGTSTQNETFDDMHLRMTVRSINITPRLRNRR